MITTEEYTAPSRNFYIALSDTDINFTFTREETLRVGRLIARGATIEDVPEIAEKLGRPEEEVLLLMLDRMEVGPLTGEKFKNWNDYVALENVDINWFWDIKEMHEIDRLHKAGESIFNIAKIMKKRLIDIVILIVDRGLVGKI